MAVMIKAMSTYNKYHIKSMANIGAAEITRCGYKITGLV
jgi:hypothetical protein